MLVELSKMEQRYDAAFCVIRDGFTVTEVAQKFGVSRESMQVWLVGYEAGAQKPSPRSPIVPVSRPSRPSGVANSNKSGNQASHRVVGEESGSKPAQLRIFGGRFWNRQELTMRCMTMGLVLEPHHDLTSRADEGLTK